MHYSRGVGDQLFGNWKDRATLSKYKLSWATYILFIIIQQQNIVNRYIFNLLFIYIYYNYIKKYIYLFILKRRT